MSSSYRGDKWKRPKGNKGKRAQELDSKPSVDTWFRNDVLSVRGYRFWRTTSWGDPLGAPHLLAEGVKVDGHNELQVIAKVGEGPSLEKEAFIFKRLSSSSIDGAARALRVVDVITIPPIDGDVKVVIYAHPRDNMLSHYVSQRERQCFLLPETEEGRERASHEDITGSTEESKLPDMPPSVPQPRTTEEAEGRNIDLSSFIHFALQAAQCLEVLHATYGAHGDIRPSTFHWAASNDLVRFAHFGTRPVHLDSFGASATLLLQTQGMDAVDQERVKDILAYLPPELAGGYGGDPTHLSDLYGLGATFWRLLAGRRPFSGTTVSMVISSVANRDPPALHYIRPDLPSVLSRIVEKLLAKHPEDRYASASGLKEDLLQCNRTLGQGWASSEAGLELIKDFPLGRADHFSTFYLPSDLFGREAESKIVQRCIHEFTSRYARRQRTVSSHVSFASGEQEATLSSAASTTSTPNHTVTVMYPSAKRELTEESGIGTRMIVVRGSGGSGKSALVARECFREMPAFALVGQAKFEAGNPTPYSAILACLSLVFRQFLTRGAAEIFSFGDSLRERLGPQINNLHLLYAAIPEIEKIVKLVWPDTLRGEKSSDTLGSAESSVRFQNLVCDILVEISTSRMVVFVLDDLHNADPSSLSMIEAFSRGRVGVLIIATLRASYTAVLDRMTATLGPRLTLVPLKPLSSGAISALVCRTLHTDSTAAAPLVAALANHSHGNPFAIRSLLTLLKNEGRLFFDFGTNSWTYSKSAVNEFLEERSKINPENVDGAFLLQHLRELPVGAQKVLSVAAAIGPSFQAQTISSFMEEMEPTDFSDDASDDAQVTNSTKLTKVWVSGLQIALAEGMVVNRGRDLYAFAHDRYMEAALELARVSSLMGGLVNISAKLVDILLDGSDEDQPKHQEYYRISDQILRSLPVLCRRQQRDTYAKVVTAAGSHAYAAGALESALLYLNAAYQLGGDGIQDDALLKLCELRSASGDLDGSESLLNRIMPTAGTILKTLLLQVQARNMFSRQQLDSGQKLLFDGLHELGITLKAEYSDEEVQRGYDETRQRLLDHGLENVKTLQPVVHEIDNLRNVLLSELFTFAYFRNQRQARMIAYEGINLALRAGLSANNALAFICFAAAAVANQHFQLGAQVGRLALDISLRLSTALDKGRCHLYFASLLAPSDSVHFSQTYDLASAGAKFARAGVRDVMFAAFGQCHLVSNRFYTVQELEDALRFADGVMDILAPWPQESEPVFLTVAILKPLQAIAGRTHATTPDTIYDMEDWDHEAYVRKTKLVTQVVDLLMNWHEAYRTAALYNLGMYTACYEAGKFVSATAFHHPGHRHLHLAYFYSGLAACELAWRHSDDVQYIAFAKTNLAHLRPLLPVAEINIAPWYHLLAAEIASFEGDDSALVTYDLAIAASLKGQWALEAAWACYLAGSYFSRKGAPIMALGFHKRAIERFSALGANGVVSRLGTVSELSSQGQFDGPIGNYVNAAVQTTTFLDMDESLTYDAPHRDTLNVIADAPSVNAEESQLLRVVQHLSAKDLATLIHALQAITTDVNLSSSLDRLNTLMTGTTSSGEYACIVLRHEESGSDFHLWTLQRPGQSVEIMSPTVPLDEVGTLYPGLLVPVIQHVLHSGKPLSSPEVEADPRFRECAESSDVKSTLVVPIRNKGITLGVLYLASSREAAFADGDFLVMDLLAMQAAVVIANGLLFASLRKSTQANLRALSEQRIALEAARKSQEEAMHATRVKSIFLANMSHEMRTPFAAFYGVLGLLWDTDLTAEQRELVSTAKSSCELLLETISALLDFSKLEAHAVKLNLAPASLTDLLVECQELLQTLASSKGLDLSYHVDPMVPFVMCDGPRIRQILQNLIGNALKFTLRGSVDVRVSVEHDDSNILPPTGDKEVCPIRIEVTDTGIGMSNADLGRLFQPFSQADTSRTRSFGGTGLGLSICRELVNLMGGKIFVTSDVGNGSRFICVIPLQVVADIPPVLRQPAADMIELRQALKPYHSRIISFSPSASTRDLLQHALRGLPAHYMASADEVKNHISSSGSPGTEPAPDIIIMDATQELVEEVVRMLDADPHYRLTRVVHILMRSKTSADSTRITRCSKPLRPLVLLRLLLQLCNSEPETQTSEITTLLVGSSFDGAATPPTLRPKLGTPTSSAPSFGPYPQKITANFTKEQLEFFKSIRILIAEDNLVAQRLLSRQLQNLGFEVVTSSNGLEAVERWQEQEPGYFRVALFDHHMPLCDGLAAARKIRVLEQENQIRNAMPIVSLTADAQAQAMEDCLEAGMQAFLTKPLRTDDLLNLVRNFVLEDGAAGL